MKNPSILPLPPDATGVEQKIAQYAYANIYRAITNPIDKFIVAFMFDMGNGVKTTAVATGLSRKTVWLYHKRIKKQLESFKLDKNDFSEAE